MPNKEHLEIMQQGSDVWNRWIDSHERQLRPDLSGADLSGISLSWAYLANVNFSEANLSGGRFYQANFAGSNLQRADLRGADLSHTDLSGANFEGCDLSGEKTNLWNAVCNGTTFRGANLSRANLSEAHINTGSDLSGKDTNLSYANLTGANLCGSNLNGANLLEANLQNANLSDSFGPVDLRGTDLSGADLYQTNLTGANLTRANLYRAFLGQANFHRAILIEADLRDSHLEGANLVEATLDRAKLTGSVVYGVSVWKATFTGAEQTGLRITPEDESIIRVDDLQVAQFIYLLTNNQQIRHVIDTVTSKVVVILGSFSKDRKRVLDAIREELGRLGLIPVLFDWDKPKSKDVTGTIETLARMARFIIADLTDPSSIPHELATLVPHLRTTPVLPLRLAGSNKGYSMFEDYQRSYEWVLGTYEYADGPSLISALPKIIAPAETMADEFRMRQW